MLGGARGLWWTALSLMLLTALGIPYFAASVQERSVLGPTVMHRVGRPMRTVTAWFPGGDARASLVPEAKMKLPHMPFQDDQPTGRTRR